MSLSFNEAYGVVLWGSEASALNVPFAHGDVQLVGGPKGVSSRSHSCTHRYDLDEDGELSGTGTKVLPNGVVIRLLDQPKQNSVQEYYEEMIGILNYPEDMSDEE